jgi:hypothetical protein
MVKSDIYEKLLLVLLFGIFVIYYLTEYNLNDNNLSDNNLIKDEYEDVYNNKIINNDIVNKLYENFVDDKKPNLNINKVEEPKPNKVEEPKPNKVEEPKPNKVEEPKPNKVEEPKSNKVEEPKPNKVEEPKPNKVEEPKPNKVEEPKSNKVEEPKPNKVEEVKINEKGSGKLEKVVNNHYYGGTCNKEMSQFINTLLKEHKRSLAEEQDFLRESGQCGELNSQIGPSELAKYHNNRFMDDLKSYDNKNLKPSKCISGGIYSHTDLGAKIDGALLSDVEKTGFGSLIPLKDKNELNLAMFYENLPFEKKVPAN